jgi:hypothetical protein
MYYATDFSDAGLGENTSIDILSRKLEYWRQACPLTRVPGGRCEIGRGSAPRPPFHVINPHKSADDERQRTERRRGHEPRRRREKLPELRPAKLAVTLGCCVAE